MSDRKWPLIRERTDLELLEHSAAVVADHAGGNADLSAVVVYLEELARRYRIARRAQKRLDLSVIESRPGFQEMLKDSKEAS